MMISVVYEIRLRCCNAQVLPLFLRKSGSEKEKKLDAGLPLSHADLVGASSSVFLCLSSTFVHLLDPSASSLF